MDGYAARLYAVAEVDCRETWYCLRTADWRIKETTLDTICLNLPGALLRPSRWRKNEGTLLSDILRRPSRSHRDDVRIGKEVG